MGAVLVGAGTPLTAPAALSGAYSGSEAGRVSPACAPCAPVFEEEPGAVSGGAVAWAVSGGELLSVPAAFWLDEPEQKVRARLEARITKPRATRARYISNAALLISEATPYEALESSAAWRSSQVEPRRWK